MSSRIRSGFAKLVVAATAGGLVLTGCASAGGANGADHAGASDAATATGAPVGIIGDQGDGGSPVPGGTLAFASYAPVASLDPTKTQATGSTGGTEMAAIYDLLIRYDTDSGRYEPQLAKSLEVSADNLTWTMKLRDGVLFSDGSPLDSAAVVASIERYNAKRGANSEVWKASVTEVAAPDPSTVVFSLGQEWSEFPAMLTFGHGLVVGTASDAGETFTPVGAGPFAVERFAPQEELALTPRADYWDGRANLDRVRFVSVQGDQAKVDSLKTGDVQMAYLRNAESVQAARAAFPGYSELISLSLVGQINSREGRPGSDIRVRQAMAMASDPVTVDQRARGGKGMPGAEIFQPWSQWHNDVAPVGVDIAKAKELVEQAKADGFDGKLTYVGVAGPDGQSGALAVQAMLQAVGFEVTIDLVNNSTDIVKRLYVDHDFDIALAGNGLLDPAPFIRLYSALHSTSGTNVLGFKSATMDATLDKIKTAGSHEEKKRALADLQTVFNEEVPLLVWGAGANFVPWNSNVYAVKPSLDSIMLLDKAWIKK